MWLYLHSSPHVNKASSIDRRRRQMTGANPCPEGCIYLHLNLQMRGPITIAPKIASLYSGLVRSVVYVVCFQAEYLDRKPCLTLRLPQLLPEPVPTN